MNASFLRLTRFAFLSAAILTGTRVAAQFGPPPPTPQSSTFRWIKDTSGNGVPTTIHVGDTLNVICECWAGYYTGIGPSTQSAWTKRFQLYKDGALVDNSNGYTDSTGTSWGYAESWSGTATSPGTWTFTGYSNGGQVASLTVTILPNTYTLTTSVGSGSGSISPSGSNSYNSGSSAHITNSPGANYKFQSYTVQVSGSSAYTTTTDPLDLTITNDTSVVVAFQPIAIGVSFTVSNNNVTYSGSPQGAQITPSVSGATYTVTYSGPGGTFGPYSCTGTSLPTGPTNANNGAAASYSISISATGIYTGSGSGTLTINPKPVSFSFGNTSNQYNGGSFNATVSPSDGSATYTSSTSYGPGVGSYTVSATANGNYSGSNSAAANITQKSIPASNFSFGNLTNTYYGGGFTASVSSSDPNVTYTSSLGYGPDAGSYTVSVTCTGNYSGSASATATVNPKSVSFSFGNLGYTYDGSSHSASVSASDGSATFSSSLSGGPNAGSYSVSASAYGNYTGSGSATLTISQKPVTFTFGNLTQAYNGSVRTATVTPSDLSATYTSSLSGGPNAGTYPVSATATGNYSGSGNATLTITNPIAVTFAFSPTTFVYDGSTHGPTITPTPGNATYTTSGTATAAAVGNYTVTATGSGQFSGTGSSAWSITAAPATFSIAGTSATYDGSPKPVTVTPTPAGATYTVTYNGSTTAPTAVGSYPVVVTATGNYSGTGNATLTIAKATPSVVWSTPAPITYGTALSSTQLNASVSPAVTGSFAYSPASGTVPGAGANNLGVTFTSTNSNYNNATGNTTLTVNKAALTVTANNQTRVYGASDPTFTLSYSGFVNGDTVANLSPAPTATSTATVTSAPGNYTITPAGGGSSNYTFTYVPGTLTITKATATVSLSNLNQTYDGGAKTATVTTTPAGLTVTTTYNGTSTAPVAVGNYTVVATVNDANYQGSASGTLVVNQAPQTVTISPSSPTVIVGNAVVFTAGGGQNGYNWGGTAGATGTGTTKSISFGTVGNYTVTVQSPSGGNFLASNVATANVTVTPNTATITTATNPAGLGTVTGGGPYPVGNTATVVAPTVTGYTFTGWSGATTATTQTASFTVTGNATATANYTINTYTVSTATNPAGLGTVSGGGPYTYNSTATVVAPTVTGYTFTGWSGPTSATTSSASFTVTGNVTATANYTINSYSVTTATSPAGLGTVSGGGTFNYNQTTTVTAPTVTGYTFTGFTGALTGATNPQTLTVTGNASITANYSANLYNVNVTITPSGSGSVAGGRTYQYGQSCTLIPTAAAGYYFAGFSSTPAGFSGAGATLTNPSPSVTGIVTQDVSVTASFSPQLPQNVTVGVPGIITPSATGFQLTWSSAEIPGNSPSAISATGAATVTPTGYVVVSAVLPQPVITLTFPGNTFYLAATVSVPLNVVSGTAQIVIDNNASSNGAIMSGAAGAGPASTVSSSSAKATIANTRAMIAAGTYPTTSAPSTVTASGSSTSSTPTTYTANGVIYVWDATLKRWVVKH